MRPTVVSVTGVGASVAIPPDYLANPFAVAVGVKVSGSVTYSVQHTFDDVFAPGFNPNTASWTDNVNMSGKTTNADSNYAFPVRGIRLNVTGGSGTATMTVMQSIGI
jgi:hypothetical protein